MAIMTGYIGIPEDELQVVLDATEAANRVIHSIGEKITYLSGVDQWLLTHTVSLMLNGLYPSVIKAAEAISLALRAIEYKKGA